MKIRKVRFVLVLVSLISLFFLVKGYSKLWDISDWPTANGRITGYESGSHSAPSHSKYRMQSVHSDEWSRIEYEYIVDGVIYTGWRISPNVGATLPDLGSGKEIPVFYNSSNHTEAYLLAQRYHNPLLLGIFAASLVALAIEIFSAKPKVAS